MADHDKYIEELLRYLSFSLETEERWEKAVRALVAERDALRIELERERMRLSACGVVAMSNTRQTAEENRQVSDEYKSASFDEVCAAVDREMALRERVAELEALSKPVYISHGQRVESIDLRERLVCAALTGMLANRDFSHGPEDMGDWAARYADAVLAEMRKGGAECLTLIPTTTKSPRCGRGRLMESDTPRTDALVDEGGMPYDADFARKLERELAAAIKQRDALVKERNSLVWERSALRQLVAELEAQLPADRDRDLRQRLVCAIWPQMLRSFDQPSDDGSRYEWQALKAKARNEALDEADAMLVAMRKGEADGR